MQLLGACADLAGPVECLLRAICHVQEIDEQVLHSGSECLRSKRDRFAVGQELLAAI